MELIPGSETSTYLIQTLGIYPEDNTLHQQHGESLKTKIKKFKMLKNRGFVGFFFRTDGLCVFVLRFIGLALKLWYWIEEIVQSGIHSPTDAPVSCLKKTILKSTLKLTLKQLRHVSVQLHHHQGAHYPCLLKLQLLKWSIKVNRIYSATPPPN
jgi:hypothetical protein